MAPVWAVSPDDTPFGREGKAGLGRTRQTLRKASHVITARHSGSRSALAVTVTMIAFDAGVLLPTAT